MKISYRDLQLPSDFQNAAANQPEFYMKSWIGACAEASKNPLSPALSDKAGEKPGTVARAERLLVRRRLRFFDGFKLRQCHLAGKVVEP